MIEAPGLLEARVGPARVFCTARGHGNVGDHVGDDPAVVARNRAVIAAQIGSCLHETGAGEPGWVWLRQVHGTGVHVATHPTGDRPPEADAAITTVPGLALAVVTADCAPLVLACGDAVGIVHAGHRGLAAGVIEATIARLRDAGSGDLRAFLGPCIRAPRYAFGADALRPFVERFGPSVAARTLYGAPSLDIPAAIRVVLERERVMEFEDCNVCTSASHEYFSYRRDGDTGRQATVALLP